MNASEKIFIVEQGGYAFRNFGDAAMLEVTLDRILARYPDACIYVVCTNPEGLAELCPQAHALPAEKLQFLEETGGLFGVLARKFSFIRSIESLLRERWFSVYIRLLMRRRALRGPALLKHEHEWIHVLFEADAVVCSGGGFVNDIWSGVQQAHLRTLLFGQRLGKKTAMFGQGFGPCTKPDLVHMLNRVARRLDGLSIREPLSSVEVCRQGGIEGFSMCGDDALALCAARPVCPPAGTLGLNIRIASYADMPDGIFSALEGVVSSLCEAYQLKPRILPISTYDTADDIEHSGKLIRSPEALREAMDIARGIGSARELIEEVAPCNLTITGSYHAAVFSLGLGIPVICLASSDYYHRKFSGLAACFEHVGAKVVDCGNPDVAAEVKRHADSLLTQDCRDQLRGMMYRQVEAANAQYGRFFQRLES